MTHPIARRTALALTAALSILTAGCSSDDGVSAELIDQGLVDTLRTVVAGRGLQPVGSAPSMSPELVALGQALFFDKEISGDRDVSCATCHLPSAAGGDARTLPRGVGGAGIGASRAGGDIVPRNSPTTLNAHLSDVMFWDGRVQLTMGGLDTPAGTQLTAAMEAVFTPGLEALAAQAMFPPTSRAEMRGLAGNNEIADEADGDFTGIWDAIVTRLVGIPAYVTMFGDAYPGVMTADINMAHVGNAIAAFEATAFHRVDSPFQRFLQGDDAALTNAQLRGALDFFSPESRCANCHSGDTFTDLRFHNIGMPQFGPGKGSGVGNDDDFGRELFTGMASDRYEFRTPTLLNVELGAPYGHVGQFSTLRSIVAHYRNVTNNLPNYDITEHVTDTDLLSTQVANESDVLSVLSNDVNMPLQFNVDDVTEFMRALTADSARDLSDTVPASVPSGLSIDS